MYQTRNLLWVDSEDIYLRTLARYLRIHARPTVNLRVRFVADLAAARKELAAADALIANPEIAGNRGDELFARWQRDGRGPAIALAAHFTARRCIQLQRLKAIVVTKDGALEEARELAAIVTDGFSTVCHARRAPTTALEATLADLIASGSNYARIAETLEQLAIRDALDRETSVNRAAERLGFKRSTLVSKMKKLGVALSIDS